MNADEIIKYLKLEKHPEGGYFRETYRSHESIIEKNLPERFESPHSFSTAIYFLLTKDDFSAFHIIKQDELWHFYGGAPIDVHVINKTGEYECLKIGNDMPSGEFPQGIVKSGSVFGSTMSENSEFDYSLVGCTVAPGFEFEDFKLLQEKELLSQFPEHESIIKRLTRI